MAHVPPPKFGTHCRVRIPKIGEVRTVVASRPWKGGPDREYVLRDEDGLIDIGWLEDELEAP